MNSIRHYVTESERWSVLNALRIAAEVVTEHASQMDEMAQRLRNGEEFALFAPGENGARACDALADQHRSNAETFRDLYSQVEDAPQIVVMESDED